MIEKNGDVPAINKMNQIFDLLALEPKGLSQSTISSLLDLPKATVSRLINTLHGMGYLEQENKAGLYTLGAKLLTLGNIVNKRLNLNTIATPIMERLCNSLNEMVKLSIMRGNIIYPLVSIESKKAIRITLDSGTVYPPYIGAAGKLLLSLTDEGKEYYNTILPNVSMVKYTKNTIVDMNTLDEAISEIKTLGYATDNQEESVGIYAVAAPIYNSTGQVIGALSIPFFGDYNEKKERYLPILLKCAEEISLSMGYYNK